MRKIIELLDAYVWLVADGAIAFVDALDFIHPIVLLAAFIGILSAIHWFLPAWVGFTLLVLIGIPLAAAMITIIYAGIASYAFQSKD